MAIVWGSIVGDYGRLGLEVSMSSTATVTTVNVTVFFWSKFSISDSANTLYYDLLASAGTASTSKGSVNLKTSAVDYQAWPEHNQMQIARYTYTYNRRQTSESEH